MSNISALPKPAPKAPAKKPFQIDPEIRRDLKTFVYVVEQLRKALPKATDSALANAASRILEGRRATPGRRA